MRHQSARSSVSNITPTADSTRSHSPPTGRLPPWAGASSAARLTTAELGEPLLSIFDVTQLCGVSDKTVRRWISSGRLVARRLGGQWRIHPTDYRNFLQLGLP
jgi:excisionase family DNA binding protein